MGSGESLFFSQVGHARRCIKEQTDSAKLYAQNALQLAEQLQSPDFEAESFNLLGKIAFEEKNRLAAEEFFSKGLEKAQADSLRYKLFVNCGIVQTGLSKYELAHKNLAHALELARNDSADQAFVLQMLGNLFLASYRYNEAIEQYRKALTQIPPSDKTRQAAMFSRIGKTFFENEEFDKAAVAYQKAYLLNVAAKDSLRMLNCLLNTGLAFQSASRYQKAVATHRKALKLAQEKNYRQGIAHALAHIAQVFSEWNQYNKALENFRAALKIYRAEGENLTYSRTLANMASVYKSMHNYSKAQKLYRQALEMQNFLGEKPEKTALTLTNLGEIYQLQNNHAQALIYFEKALAIYTQTRDVSGQAKLLYYSGQQAFATQNIVLAQEKFRESLVLAKKTSDRLLLKSLHLSLAQLYKRQSDWKNAIAHYERYVQLKDSLFSLETHHQLAELQTLYENEKQQRQIDSLSAEKRLQQTELLRQKKLRVSFLAGFLLVSLLSVLLGLQFLKKNRAYKLLVNKNNELLSLRTEYVYSKHTSEENLPLPPANEKTADVVELLEKLMQNEKLFLNKDLTISKVAKRLETNRTYLSEEIRQHFGCNFSDYIKQYRIKEAMLRLTAPENLQLTIEAVAGEVGFNSKSTFNTAFKKITGVTPSFYREQTLARKKEA